MGLWYNKEVYKTTKIYSKSSTGQQTIKYQLSTLFEADIQPLSKQLAEKEWGVGILARNQMYADELIQTGEIVVWQDITYMIEDGLNWDDYNIYALKRVEVDLLVN